MPHAAVIPFDLCLVARSRRDHCGFLHPVGRAKDSRETADRLFRRNDLGGSADALKAGKTTVIIPTGGVEQNGPYVVTGKHNYIVRATSDAIARKLGNALSLPSSLSCPKGESRRRPCT